MDIDLYDRENGKWHIAIVGFNREGLIEYGISYGRLEGQISYASLDGGFTLNCNKWYKAKLVAILVNLGMTMELFLSYTLMVRSMNGNYHLQPRLITWYMTSPLELTIFGISNY
ncbi:hypothetical protein DRO64_07260 [Candidatus Bathyarchaeota archaeon]|nr:MAG: hypothetical protein DRO64_07260 [Candidatus Bathyarchaeota archaeon]